MSQIPETPRVISPTPSASETTTADSYFPPTTRSATKRRAQPPHMTSRERASSSSSDAETRRARSRSRSVDVSLRSRRPSGKKKKPPPPPPPPSDLTSTPAAQLNGTPMTNGYLSPGYWRDFSRSPSPLGLIPLHRSWRTLVHRHELPRKALHVSIGFLTLRLYTLHYQPSDIHPVLLTALVPIASVDLLRHNWPPFNRLYVRLCGAFMREAEVHAKYNGVIWYLLGTWVAMRFFPKDVGVLSIVLLSWCDTAASTVGRWLGRYTPRVRRGKSLAGSVAAFCVGVVSCAVFLGGLVPRVEGARGEGGWAGFAFQGRLGLPGVVRAWIGGGEGPGGEVTGRAAAGVMSLVAGLVVSVSEAVDVGGLDDNVTIPVLCGLGLWGFLKIFG